MYILVWMIPAAVALHNIEEAIWLPRWSKEHRLRPLQSVEAKPFRFAVLVLTIVPVVFALLSRLESSISNGAYLLGAFAIGQSANIVFPHLLASIKTRSAMPGLTSGAMFVWPATAVYMLRLKSLDDFSGLRLGVSIAIVIPMALLSIPLLFKIGRHLEALSKK